MQSNNNSNQFSAPFFYYIDHALCVVVIVRFLPAFGFTEQAKRCCCKFWSNSSC
jgi:hypothetical protein